MIEFSKYHGAGNDFIIIDDRTRQFDTEDQQKIENLCHRRFGIGADGLMLLRSHEGFNFEMVYFNSDGRTSSMCGNGGRCIAAFAHRLGLTKKQVSFQAIDGAHQAVIVNADTISLEMNDVNTIERVGDALYLDTGSPHYIQQVNNLKDLDIIEEAHRIRYSERFNQFGVNVNFVEMINGTLHIRTYERGVEAETLACGTGVTAAAIASNYWGLVSANYVDVKAVGGSLSVRFEKQGETFTNIWKTGPVAHVFDGTIAE